MNQYDNNVNNSYIENDPNSYFYHNNILGNNDYPFQYYNAQNIYYQSIIMNQNNNLLTNNLIKLSEINIDQINQIKENNHQLEKDNHHLKRKLSDLEYKIEYMERDNKKSKIEPEYNQKKYYYKPIKSSFTKEEILEVKEKIHNINDIINLEDKFMQIRHDTQLIRLYYAIPSLKKLSNLVGMKQVKEEIFKHIIYYVKNLDNHNQMLHTAITGPPGTGKTELGSILADIYLAIGAVKKNIFKKVRRSDLIASYLGQTATKTQKVIDECDGGVLFIDEAYSLGNNEQRDSYSKECLDTINQNLTEKKNNFICIIAGYPDQLEKCFFAYNPGLERRFSFRYQIESYCSLELVKIFQTKVQEANLECPISQDQLESFFEQHYKKFKFFGGDIEKLFFYAKLESSQRCFQQDIQNQLILTDLENCISKLETNQDQDNIPHGIYN